MPNANRGLPAPPPELLDGTVSLFLDFDGTLVEFAERHDAIAIPPELPALIAALARRLDGRLAIVSGRAAHEIEGFLKTFDHPPGFMIAGSHGLELVWPDGHGTFPEPPPALAEATAKLRAFAANREGVVVEAKPLGVALHYRQAPHEADAAGAIAAELAELSGLAHQPGKMVHELRVDGSDKGGAVREIMAQPMMQGSRPLFLGDDLTDEAGFAAAQDLGGAGLLVGRREGSTHARYRLDDVAAVHSWLGAIAGEPA